MDLKAWLRLLDGNILKVSADRIGLLLATTLVALIHTLASPFVSAWERRQQISSRMLTDDQSPLFIIGHSRSGTTLLHELLCCVHGLRAPTTYQCFNPRHFLLTERLVARVFNWALPKVRGFDNVEFGWSSPQEDEFALLMMGASSPYRRIAFPCSGDQLNGIDITQLTLQQRLHWTESLMLFVRRLMFNDSRRLVLKNPFHTARISTLLRLFPGAKFIFITRNPFNMIPSAIKLWTYLDFFHGLSSSCMPNYMEYSLALFAIIETAYLRDKPLLASNNLVEIRFEDLIADPVRTLDSIILAFGMQDLQIDKAALQSTTSKISPGFPDQYHLTIEEKQRIYLSTKEYCWRYGYAQDHPARTDDLSTA